MTVQCLTTPGDVAWLVAFTNISRWIAYSFGLTSLSGIKPANRRQNFISILKRRSGSIDSCACQRECRGTYLKRRRDVQRCSQFREEATTQSRELAHIFASRTVLNSVLGGKALFLDASFASLVAVVRLCDPHPAAGALDLSLWAATEAKHRQVPSLVGRNVA